MNSAALHIVILAAGKGTRMQSTRHKVLQLLAGQPLLAHVLKTARSLEPAAIHCVIGSDGEVIRKAVDDRVIHWVEQREQLGTGHAVAQALPAIPDKAQVLVLYGDTPLCSRSDLQALLQPSNTQLAVLGMELPDPTGYGRLLCDGEGLRAIVEEKDADENEKAIHRVNTGIMAGPVSVFRQCEQLQRDNAQQEAYLTDLVAMERKAGRTVRLVMAADAHLCLGCNTPVELQRLERIYQQKQAEALMNQGVRLMDASRLDIRGEVTVGQDVELDINVILEGHCILGDGVRIGAGCVLNNVTLEEGVNIHPYSVLEDCHVGAYSSIGPFARIRPGSSLQGHNKVGNFVELKNATVGMGSKINHLSYVGDTRMGAQVNVGAGTITCNYDGASKHVTVIGDDVFIGSNTALVAPMEVGDGATIGAGSTLSKDVEANSLAVERAPARTIRGWKRPRKPRH